jgi:phosphatidylserine/phosphatidylglycerophosphate/cardiolipin synthase-like enzyme
VLTFALLGALASARRSIRIVTPYFLPDLPLVYALNTAALGGLEVDIVIPEEGEPVQRQSSLGNRIPRWNEASSVLCLVHDAKWEE